MENAELKTRKSKNRIWLYRTFRTFPKSVSTYLHILDPATLTTTKLMFCDVNAKVIMGGVLISLSFECVIQIWGMSTVVAQFWVTIISPQWTPYHPDLSEPSEFTQNWGNDMNHPELRESLLNHPDLTPSPIFEGGHLPDRSKKRSLSHSLQLCGVAVDPKFQKAT